MHTLIQMMAHIHWKESNKGKKKAKRKKLSLQQNPHMQLCTHQTGKARERKKKEKGEMHDNTHGARWVFPSSPYAPVSCAAFLGAHGDDRETSLVSTLFSTHRTKLLRH